jgi:hypothetical protein
VYVDTATPQQLEDAFNTLFPQPGGPLRLPQIMARAAETAVREGLLKLRREPFVFHQANMAADGAAPSLVMQWLDAVVAEAGRYVTWPIVSTKQEALFKMYRGRAKRDACAPKYTLDVSPETGSVTSVTLSRGGGGGAAASAPCVAPLMVQGARLLAGADPAVKASRTGAEPTTYRVTLPPARAKPLTFALEGAAWSIGNGTASADNATAKTAAPARASASPAPAAAGAAAAGARTAAVAVPAAAPVAAVPAMATGPTTFVAPAAVPSLAPVSAAGGASAGRRPALVGARIAPVSVASIPQPTTAPAPRRLGPQGRL